MVPAERGYQQNFLATRKEFIKNHLNEAANFSVALDVVGLVSEYLAMPYRVYIDESGDHTFNAVEDPTRRYLGLTAVVFRKSDYRPAVPRNLEDLKSRHFPYDVDKPFPLIRSAIKQGRSHFWALRDPGKRGRWEVDLLQFLTYCSMQVFTVVYDKLSHSTHNPGAAQVPYNVSLALLLEAVARWLSVQNNGVADIMLESRNRTLDEQLRAVYQELRNLETDDLTPTILKTVYPADELLFGTKEQNIAGLQIADLLAAEQKMLTVLESRGADSVEISSFGQQINHAVAYKVNAEGRLLV